jgi:hypothetical protein
MSMRETAALAAARSSGFSVLSLAGDMRYLKCSEERPRVAGCVVSGRSEESRAKNQSGLIAQKPHSPFPEEMSAKVPAI